MILVGVSAIFHHSIWPGNSVCELELLQLILFFFCRLTSVISSQRTGGDLDSFLSLILRDSTHKQTLGLILHILVSMV